MKNTPLDERWLEMDLYWFQSKNIDQRVNQLFDRIEPLFSTASTARNGLCLCVGWLFDAVLYWNDNGKDLISTCQAPKYEKWTYDRLKSLNQKIKLHANKRGIKNFHLSIILMGIETQYFPESAGEGWGGRTEETKEKAGYDIKGTWFYEHPEVMDERYGKFTFGSPVKIPKKEKGTFYDVETFGLYFARKLSRFTSDLGFDAVILRDHIFTPAYIRGNHKHRYLPQSAINDLNDSIISTLREIKKYSPELVTVGYSSGTSPMEEWRSHGFDLEKVALSGHLNLWITQTWASAWQDYWPAESMGYTFQLTAVLAQQAMLANTPCKHLFLLEMFDAWEPWDSIHQYPNKVAWELIAYSHAGVLMPKKRIYRSSGYYLSWLHRKEELLPKSTVTWVSTKVKEAIKSLQGNSSIGGPCFIYPRKGLETLIAQGGKSSKGENFDDWLSMLMKFGVPFLSTTREEWATEIEADAYVLLASSGYQKKTIDSLLKRKNKSILLIGQSDQWDSYAKKAFGIQTLKNPIERENMTVAEVHPSIQPQHDCEGVQILQKRQSLAKGNNWEPILTVKNHPIFQKARQRPLFVWETPEWGTLRRLDLPSTSVGSLETYQIIASFLNANGYGKRRLIWRNRLNIQPICWLYWRSNNDQIDCALLSNLETKFTGNSQFASTGKLFLKKMSREIKFDFNLKPVKFSKVKLATRCEILITLNPHKTASLRL